MSKNNKRACVFAHYDMHNKVDDYVYYYLDALCVVVSKLVFVTVVDISQDDKNKLADRGVEVIVRDNAGYDFLSYKVGMEMLDFDDYDELIICNDSVYGPLFDLNSLFLAANEASCDFWGVVDSYQIDYHIQSYFMVFNKNVIQSPAFRRFWNDICVLNDKSEIIKEYEIGLTKKLISNNFIPFSLHQVQKMTYIQAFGRYKRLFLSSLMRQIISGRLHKNLFSKLKGINKVNNSHFDWEYMVVKNKIPFVKVELLRDNPCQLGNAEQYSSIISHVSSYPVNLIAKHLKRISP